MFRKQWDNAGNIIERKEEFNNLPSDSVNTVVLGSSGPFNGINPAVLYEESEIYSYNLSSDFNYLPIRFHQVQELLENRSIRLLITDCSNLYFTEAELSQKDKMWVYKTGYNFMDDFSRRKEYVNDLKPFFNEINVSDFWFPFFVHHTNWHKVNSDKIEGSSPYNIMGCKMNYTNVKKVEPIIDNDNHEILPVTQEYLLDIVKLCKENDIYLFLIDTPRYNYRVNMKVDLERILGGENFVFTNYSDPEIVKKMGINYDMDFHDNGHLNVKGADKFSRYLANDISKLFPDVAQKEMSIEKESIWRNALSEYKEFEKNQN
jgi:hypothetical protein